MGRKKRCFYKYCVGKKHTHMTLATYQFFVVGKTHVYICTVYIHDPSILSPKKRDFIWWFPFRHRATPSHHPFSIGIFHEINQPASFSWYPKMAMETPKRFPNLISTFSILLGGDWLPWILFSHSYWVSIITPTDSYFSEGWLKTTKQHRFPMNLHHKENHKVIQRDPYTTSWTSPAASVRMGNTPRSPPWFFHIFSMFHKASSYWSFPHLFNIYIYIWYCSWFSQMISSSKDVFFFFFPYEKTPNFKRKISWENAESCVRWGFSQRWKYCSSSLDGNIFGPANFKRRNRHTWTITGYITDIMYNIIHIYIYIYVYVLICTDIYWYILIYIYIDR